MDCELCGRQDTLVNAIVERAPMKVCRYCARHGHVIALETPPEIILEERRKTAKLDIPEEVIVDDYGSLIKHAREKLKLTQEELALKLNEKESIIHKLESFDLEPSFELARKLERYLDLKLIQPIQESKSVSKIIRSEAMTIGDLLSMKK